MLKSDKHDLFKEFMLHEKDCGSIEIQIVLLSEKIKYLTEHMKKHKKDFHSCMGLIKKVSKRKKFLKYLKNKNEEKYKDLIQKLNIRK